MTGFLWRQINLDHRAQLSSLSLLTDRPSIHKASEFLNQRQTEEPMRSNDSRLGNLEFEGTEAQLWGWEFWSSSRWRSHPAIRISPFPGIGHANEMSSLSEGKLHWIGRRLPRPHSRRVQAARSAREQRAGSERPRKRRVWSWGETCQTSNLSSPIEACTPFAPSFCLLSLIPCFFGKKCIHAKMKFIKDLRMPPTPLLSRYSPFSHWLSRITWTAGWMEPTFNASFAWKRIIFVMGPGSIEPLDYRWEPDDLFNDLIGLKTLTLALDLDTKFHFRYVPFHVVFGAYLADHEMLSEMLMSPALANVSWGFAPEKFQRQFECSIGEVSAVDDINTDLMEILLKFPKLEKLTFLHGKAFMACILQIGERFFDNAFKNFKHSSLREFILMCPPMQLMDGPTFRSFLSCFPELR